MHSDRRDAEHQLAALDAPGRVLAHAAQGFRTKIFLSLSDDFSAQMARDLCGKEEQLKAGLHA